jgi:RNA polymerase sigma-70 factor (ECF subfamily)
MSSGLHSLDRLPGSRDRTTADSRDLLRRAKAGSARALDELFRTELPLLRRWAYRHVPRPLWHRADPDDLVQLTFLRALRRYRSFESRPEAEFQHYLRRVLVNLASDEARRGRRETAALELPDVPAPVQPSTLDRMLGREAYRRFRAVLRTLSPRARTALLARFEDGMTYAQIAELIRAPGAGAARAVVTRAVDLITKRMRAQPGRTIAAELKRRTRANAKPKQKKSC